MNRITIKINEMELSAEIYNTPTGNEILKSLPIKAGTIIWGKEIYFNIPVSCSLEADSRDLMEVGELGYYPPMQAFCIFYGPTPMSRDHKPRAADKVNVFGKLVSSMEELDNVKHGDWVFVEKG